MELQLFVTPSCPLSAGIVLLTYTGRHRNCAQPCTAAALSSRSASSLLLNLPSKLSAWFCVFLSGHTCGQDGWEH